MRKTINGLILALAVCAIPSYGLAKNKNKIAELGQKINIASQADNELGGLKDLRARVEQAERSYDAATSSYENMKTQINSFESDIEAASQRAQNAQSEKDALQKDLDVAKADLEKLNKEITENGGEAVVVES